MSILDIAFDEATPSKLTVQLVGPNKSTRLFTGVVTQYHKGEPLFSVTYSHKNWRACLGRLMVMHQDVVADRLRGRQRLPSSGDEGIQYFGTT